MAFELWRWQDGTAMVDELAGAAAGPNGSTVLAGFTDGDWSGANAGSESNDFVALKLDADGALQWRWQDGGSGKDELRAAAMDQDGSTVLAGKIEAGTIETPISRFAAVKLDADGAVVWSWQNGTETNDVAYAVAITGDSSAVLAGHTFGIWEGIDRGSLGDFAAMKLDVNGDLLWKWQDGSTSDDKFMAAVIDADDCSVFAGRTGGDWSGDRPGDNGNDFVAVKLDPDGVELWRWQNGTAVDDVLCAAAIDDGGSVVLAGSTAGSWDGVHAGGDRDFAAVKLSADGEELWRWQGGTIDDESFVAAAMGADGSVVLAGSTWGSWDGPAAGQYDFAAVKLDANGAEQWRWQGGSYNDDGIKAIAAWSDGRMILAGQTWGEWDGVSNGEGDFAAIMLNTSAVTVPTPSPENPSLVPAPSAAEPTTGDTPPAGDTIAPTPTLTTAPTPGASNAPVIIGVVSAAVVGVLVAVVILCRKRRNTKALLPPIASFGGVSVLSPDCDGSGRIGSVDYTKGPPQPRSFSVLDAVGASPRENSSPTGSVVVPTPDAADTVPADRWGGTAPSATVIAAPKLSPALLRSGAWVGAPVDGIRGNGDGTRDTTYRELVGEGFPAVLGSEDSPEKVKSAAGLIPGASASVSVAGEGEVVTEGGSPNPSDHFGVAQAVIDAAYELAIWSQFPGVSEAATLVGILVGLIRDSRGGVAESEGSIKRCRSIVFTLQRATSVLNLDKTKGIVDGGGEAERVLIEDVHVAVSDMVELIKAYQSKNKISQVVMSTLFRRRQEEAEAVIDRAVLRLHLGLSVQVAQDLNDVGDTINGVGQTLLQVEQKLDEVGDNVNGVGQTLLQVERRMDDSGEHVKESIAESLAKARRVRRKRNLDQVEIPEDHVSVTDELLGKGGFGSVFIADYNGYNAAAKVVQIDHDIGGSDSPGTGDPMRGGGLKRVDAARTKTRRNAFLRELEAMIRLRSPYTVNVYGAITSRSDHLVLVMELLAGGDLRAFLDNNANQPLGEERARCIISDVCAGMAFLHSRDTIHGDLKSANVLLDAAGRAKLGDFGTSRWVQHTTSTGLATYTAKTERSTHLSFVWAAPEVLDGKGSSYASDVYSFAVVAWEVLSRKTPWAEEALSRDNFLIRVLLKGERPVIPADAPVDLAGVISACWAQAPEKRPAFSEILEGMNSPGHTSNSTSGEGVSA